MKLPPAVGIGLQNRPRYPSLHDAVFGISTGLAGEYIETLGFVHVNERDIAAGYLLAQHFTFVNPLRREDFLLADSGLTSPLLNGELEKIRGYRAAQIKDMNGLIGQPKLRSVGKFVGGQPEFWRTALGKYFHDPSLVAPDDKKYIEEHILRDAEKSLDVDGTERHAKQLIGQLNLLQITWLF